MPPANVPTNDRFVVIRNALKHFETMAYYVGPTYVLDLNFDLTLTNR